MSRGKLFIVSAPSGAGKTSLLAAVREQLPELTIAVSHTTRQARPGEIDGVHYHFISKEEFSAMVDGDEFLEHANVFGNYYGTSKQEVNRLLEKGKNVVLEIDWQGARQVRKIYPQATSIFIYPPSVTVLENRLRSRGQDSEEIIAQRMKEAKDELSHHDDFQFHIINDEFERALTALSGIFTAPEDYVPPDKNLLTRVLADL